MPFPGKRFGNVVADNISIGSDDTSVSTFLKIDGNVSQTGTAAFSGPVSISGSIVFEGGADVDGNLNCSDINIAGDMVLYGNADMTGGTLICSDIFVEGDLTVNGSFSLSDTEFTGDVSITSGTLTCTDVDVLSSGSLTIATSADYDSADNMGVADTSLAHKKYVDDKLKTKTFALPISGITDNIFNWVGEGRVHASGQTGDYTTDFGAQNQHIVITVNSITSGGNVVITGTSVSESTAIPVSSDTETLTLDGTTSSYQTEKKWLEITNIDVSDTTDLNYDIEILGYFDFGNNDWELVGYRADMRTSGNTSDLALILTKVQDEGGKKVSMVVIEDYGHDSTPDNGNYFDGKRTGGDSRDYTTGSNLAPNNSMVCYKMFDFSTFFSSNENIFEGSKDEGLIVSLEGRDSVGGLDGISFIDHITLTLFYKN